MGRRELELGVLPAGRGLDVAGGGPREMVLTAAA